MSAVHTVQVGGTQPYAIDIGPGLLGDGTRLAARARGRHALLLSDSHVAPLYADTVTDALRRARPGLFGLQPPQLVRPRQIVQAFQPEMLHELLGGAEHPRPPRQLAAPHHADQLHRGWDRQIADTFPAQGQQRIHRQRRIFPDDEDLHRFSGLLVRHADGGDFGAFLLSHEAADGGARLAGDDEAEP